MSCDYVIRCDRCQQELGVSTVAERLARRHIVNAGTAVITYTGDYCAEHVPADQDPRQIMKPWKGDDQ